MISCGTYCAQATQAWPIMKGCAGVRAVFNTSEAEHTSVAAGLLCAPLLAKLRKPPWFDCDLSKTACTIGVYQKCISIDTAYGALYCPKSNTSAYKHLIQSRALQSHVDVKLKHPPWEEPVSSCSHAHPCRQCMLPRRRQVATTAAARTHLCSTASSETSPFPPPAPAGALV
jgi:hypothetical protein